MKTSPPTLGDIELARAVVDARAPRTPTLRSHALSRIVGGDVHLKLDCLGPMGSFKWRGALNRIAHLTADERARGVITASTGNHGAAVAWAARMAGAPATVVLPLGMPQIKRDNVSDEGARILEEGENWNASCLVARRIAAERDLLYIEDGEDPLIMAGAGVVGLDMLEEVPDADVLLVPVGGGNLIGGIAIAAKALRPEIKIVGVQSEAAQGVTLSWRSGAITSAACETFAGGIATTGPVEMAFEVMRAHVDDMLLVSEDELVAAIGFMAARHALIVEGAGAAAVAALLRYAARFAGVSVVAHVSGRNLAPATLARALASAS